ncbi:hypothetical protein [Lactonifactor longoviformis]|nr:hypothetical protein [Lactonifactor longoviformis]
MTNAFVMLYFDQDADAGREALRLSAGVDAAKILDVTEAGN